MSRSLSLLFHHKNKVDFILEQIGCDRKTFTIDLDTTHVDGFRLYLICDKEKVRMFPGEKVGSTEVQLKHDNPEVMFILRQGNDDCHRLHGVHG